MHNTAFTIHDSCLARRSAVERNHFCKFIHDLPFAPRQDENRLKRDDPNSLTTHTTWHKENPGLTASFTIRDSRLHYLRPVVSICLRGVWQESQTAIETSSDKVTLKHSAIYIACWY